MPGWFRMWIVGIILRSNCKAYLLVVASLAEPEQLLCPVLPGDFAGIHL